MIRVGVIRGGISSEYDVSLNTGANVLSHLRSEAMNSTYKPIDILIDKAGVWHMSGKPVSIEHVSNSVDVIFNALHGDFGEDGKVQTILEQWNIPYTGSGPFPSAVGYNKVLAKEQFIRIGVKTPQYLVYEPYDQSSGESIEDYSKNTAKNIWEKMPPSWVVKPLLSGSSVGVRVCKTYQELVEALIESVQTGCKILIEEMIGGKEATVPVVEGFRTQKLYVLPPVEIRVPSHKVFFDYEAKYSGISQEICPGNFTTKEKEELMDIATLIHKGLNLSHYSRSDFIIHPKKGIYALEVNTLPGLTDESITPKAIRAVGASMPEFIHHIISLALKKI